MAGIPPRTLGHYIAATNEPSATSLMKIAEACDVSVDWLLKGDGDDRFTPSQNAKFGDANFGRVRETSGNDELFGRVFDAVHRLYKEERVALPPIDLGRLAFRKYSEIIDATGDPEECGAMIKLIVAQLRAEIRAAQAAPGTGKASA